LLGRADVNIASMQVARHSEGGEALMVMAVDSPIPAEVLDEIVTRAEMRDARAIVLDRTRTPKG
jgi:D-3-phosphoglycerate dehydrogenase / 2-oxoglutarate reductase